MQPAPRKIQISVPDQELRLMEGESVLAAWPVSTSKYGTGSQPGSNKTPVGHFKISECHGGEAPIHTIFKSRQPVGRYQPGEVVPEDLVLTRILWLEGCEEQNANTKDRYIYIHGTNDEAGIGRPLSIGCVRMRNPDVIALYEQVGPGTEVEILA